MRPLPMLLLPLAATAVLVAAPGVQADCPSSQFAVGCWDAVVELSTQPTACAGGTAWTPGQPCGAGYDAPNGALHAEAASTIYDNPTGCHSTVELIDDYELVGATPGQVLSCQAVLGATGSIASAGSFGIQLYDEVNPGGSVGWFATTPSPSVSGTIVLSLTMIAGHPLRLHALLGAGGDYPEGAAKADGVLRFSGLPRGVSVTSCRAYNLPVPASTTSWGRLKSTYR